MNNKNFTQALQSLSFGPDDLDRSTNIEDKILRYKKMLKRTSSEMIKESIQKKIDELEYRLRQTQCVNALN